MSIAWTMLSTFLILLFAIYASLFSSMTGLQILLRGLGAFVLVAVISARISAGRPFNLQKDLTGKVAIVTGGNSGIGKESAKRLGQMGAHVIIACRSRKKGEAALNELKQSGAKGTFEFAQLDLASLESVKAFCDDFNSKGRGLDILLNNAGVMHCPFSKTADGIEMQFGTNHVGHFVLTTRLLDALEASNGRVVNLSSLAYKAAPRGIELETISEEKTYDKELSYGVSKLANILFSMELSRRLKERDSNVITCSLHPGVVKTDIGRHRLGGISIFMELLFVYVICPMIMRNVYQGANTSMYCCISDDIQSGEFYQNCGLGKTDPTTVTKQAAKDLWDLTESLLGQ